MGFVRFLTVLGCAILVASAGVAAGYTNFEASHVHPVAVAGNRLIAVNTPDALLEVFTIAGDGSLTPETSIPVGLEPVGVVARTATEAWVVNHLSDSVSIVDLDAGVVTRTLPVGDEPVDVAFANGRAFVAVSQLDLVRVYDLQPTPSELASIPLSGRDVRALATDGANVYAVVLRSGNRTAVINNQVAWFNNPSEDSTRLNDLGLRGIECEGVPGGVPPAAYPPLPAGITRDATLPVPPLGNPPKVSLIVRWNEATGRWEDETGTDWSHCLQFRPADDDLFVIDATSLAVSTVKQLGTSLFDVSVQPGGKVWVPHTEARNFVPVAQHPVEGSGRFEHSRGIRGRVVDNRVAVVDPGAGFAVSHIDLNGHIDRSVTPGPLVEREASISQPGMMVWKGDGSKGYLTAIGSRKLFRVDGSCAAAGCIFGATRSAPDAVQVGEGPTGVALLENVPAPGTDRLYVLNRISHSLSLVDATSSGMTLVEEIPLHDPGPASIREGRRFLYDAIDTSGHGDAACSSCHLSGDLDGLTWELGDPEGEFTPYSEQFDNVRFVTLGGVPCDPVNDPGCSVATGFDPHKGPMATQTLRGMLEPLHWRGDQSTMRGFNAAFVNLMGTANVGTPTDPKGLSDADMDKFRQFALGIEFPPNPYRTVDDALPNTDVTVHGMLRPGNPAQGLTTFDTAATDGGGPCVACHAHPFGAAGGKLGGVEPAQPTSTDATALFSGAGDLAIPNDMEVPHLRNMYEKFGPRWAEPGPMTCGNVVVGQCDNDLARSCTVDLDCSKPETVTTFGHIHDGSIPDLYRFLSATVFSVSVTQIDDLVAFMFHFPTGQKASVGRHLTVPAGTPPTGTGQEEALLSDLIDCTDGSCGDLAHPDPHCNLVAAAVSGGRMRRYHLSGGSWVTDVAAEPAVSTTSLRENAQSPVSFLCAPLLSGARLGGNRDEDPRLDGDDCAANDPSTWQASVPVDDVAVAKLPATELTWTDQSASTGPSQRYDVLGGTLSDLRATGFAAAACVQSDLGSASFTDSRPAPAAGDGYYYFVRAENPCGAGDLGPGREGLSGLICPP